MDVNRLYKRENLERSAKKVAKENNKLVNKLKAKKPKKLDDLIHGLDEKAFKKIDCLECANCCRALGPRVTPKDIERLSKYLRVKQKVFIDTYLRVDEDRDYVFKGMPCPFLGEDNYCSVYDKRPKACQEYPHTTENKMVKHLQLMQDNCSTCPAVYYIFEGLKEEFSVEKKD